jgi:NitT/TauT family transport system permease protein
MRALAYTAAITLGAFALAVVSGVTLGVLLTQNRAIERVFWPYAVALQVTPMVAIAPLVVIWVGLDRVWLALLILAWIVAFFPMLSNTAIGMKSADHGLRDVFTLYGGSRWKRFRYLQLPAALPFILAGARISAGLSVIGAVVAEFVAGSGSSTGLAWTILESGSMLNVPRMFAALVVLSVFGLSIWYATATVQRLLLRHWHESEVRHES